MNLPVSQLVKSQTREFGPRDFGQKDSLRRPLLITAFVRWDDQCNNGHNSFSITGKVEAKGARDWEMGGCIHHEIAKFFPELAPLIKYHLMGADGPMHYVGNTTYHAGDRDHDGLLKGEARQIRNGKTGRPSWKLKDCPLPEYVDSDEKPTGTFLVEYEPWCRIGVGKERDLRAARSVACWPEATDEELMLPAPVLAMKLRARLPQLMEEFKAAITAPPLSFTY